MVSVQNARASRTERRLRGRRSARVSPRVNLPELRRGSAISSRTITQATLVPTRYSRPSYPVRRDQAGTAQQGGGGEVVPAHRQAVAQRRHRAVAEVELADLVALRRDDERGEHADHDDRHEQDEGQLQAEAADDTGGESDQVVLGESHHPPNRLCCWGPGPALAASRCSSARRRSAAGSTRRSMCTVYRHAVRAITTNCPTPPASPSVT